METLTYHIIHEGSALHQNTGIVRKLCPEDIGTVVLNVAAIPHVDLVVEKPHIFHPVPRLNRVLGIRLVARISRQPSTQVEKDTIRYRILIVISDVNTGDLPAHAATAHAIVPVRIHLGVPDRLCQRQPLWLIRGWVWEVDLGRQHGRHAPEPLVVIAQ